MKLVASGVLALLTMCGGALAQPKSAAAGSVEAELKAIEAKWDAANLKGDIAALDAIFAASFITTNAEGKTRTKAEVLASLKSGETKYQSAQADDLKVTVYGDAAVVNGRWKGKVVEKGKLVDSTERFTDFFVKQNGQWKCVASHASNIK